MCGAYSRRCTMEYTHIKINTHTQIRLTRRPHFSSVRKIGIPLLKGTVPKNLVGPSVPFLGGSEILALVDDPIWVPANWLSDLGTPATGGGDSSSGTEAAVCDRCIKSSGIGNTQRHTRF
eukprot:Gregarina_sp_Poly_1__709@NODE_116_length_13672_cov_23_062992_g103_i0_p11_GENE_NODE_116_length_13672_cov_23_062992_g103_i0NODE_116_length_13672_cov_23_062992_g103_i0_p11_ORF_typecomplete_len120_score9_66_NODE_116_length_13672_cov_23_062992_g103_i0507866